MYKIFNIKYLISKLKRSKKTKNHITTYNIKSNSIDKDRYDGYNFHDFMEKLSNEGTF